MMSSLVLWFTFVTFRLAVGEEDEGGHFGQFVLFSQTVVVRFDESDVQLVSFVVNLLQFGQDLLTGLAFLSICF